jgi:Domain of unknown function (DUF4265)
MVSKINATDFISVHLSPAWANKANFKIFADIAEDKKKPEWEQLWVNRENDQSYQICCIPFFTYGIALGDIVTVDDRLVITKKLSNSGHKTVRIWFADTPVSISSEFGAELFSLGYILEWQSKKMLALSAANQNQFDDLIEFLDAKLIELGFEYELG